MKNSLKTFFAHRRLFIRKFSRAPSFLNPDYATANSIRSSCYHTINYRNQIQITTMAYNCACQRCSDSYTIEALLSLTYKCHTIFQPLLILKSNYSRVHLLLSLSEFIYLQNIIWPRKLENNNNIASFECSLFVIQTSAVN